MEPAISIQNLSKKYAFQSTQHRYISLRDVISNSIKNLFRPSRSTEFLALNNLNLIVDKGERIGIIGSNGAGKSTLLKILSKITPPTEGRIIINGIVASLLEVGTGFHPELTGMENIYLNGSILGLSKKEIDSKKEQIIEFSGVSKFIHTQLKHYSSGMQLRLAFAVAAHLEPDILLIDEVLAVGDIEFQEKCLGKMEEISRQEGRTILFVSHNLAAVSRLCNRAIVLRSGEKVFDGNVANAIDHYTKSFSSVVNREQLAVFDLKNHPNKVNASEGIQKAKMYVDDLLSELFIPGSTLKVVIEYYINSALIDPDVGIVIKDSEQNALIGLNNKHLGKKVNLKVKERSEATIIIPELNIFKPGKYSVNLYFGDNYHYYECLYDAFQFTIAESDVYNSGVLMDAEWNKIFAPRIDIF
ncbi:MAG: ABC transporter ATP-binding protein [Flavisolibacter sp.]